MKPKKGETRGKALPQPAMPQPTGAPSMLTMPWRLGIALVALVIVFWAYGPAVHGGFLFDDTLQQFARPSASAPLATWIGRVRPVLMFSYWINSQISGQDTYSFHVFNVLFHCITTFLIFLIVRRLVEQLTDLPNQTRDLLAAFAALIFLLHPAQTESVAYIAGRSESLSGLFAAAAYAVFLYRPQGAVSLITSAAVLALFTLAVFSKEQAVVLPALFLLTDLWLNPGQGFRTIRSNWRLYLPIAAVGVAAVAVFWKLIMSIGTGVGGSAGFGMKDLTWYEYLFTQFRAIFVYIGTFLFPVNLTLDWDFPISKNIFDHGAIAGLVVLAALAAVAWHFRGRFPLAALGYFIFLLLLSPTSSVLPIRDPVAERRMYLPMLGLLLILVDFVWRLKIDRKALAAAGLVVLLISAVMTHARAEVWSGPVPLWEDTVRKSPNKARDHLQLALAYYDQGSFDRAVAEYQKAADLAPPDYNLLLDWALAYDGLNQPEKALAKLQQAAAMEPTAHVYSQMGMIYGKGRQWKEAMRALDIAEKIDPSFAMTYYYKGVVHLSTMDATAAAADFAKALAADPTLQPAREGLAQAQRAQRALRPTP
jgi:tetratricopeptide (TPR) repeat protein